MRKSQKVGTKYEPDVDKALDRNQASLVDELTTPHTRINEMLGAKHKIVSSVPAHEPDAQPVQGSGKIVWNRAYSFQAHGPSYLDPIPDPGHGGGH